MVIEFLGTPCSGKSSVISEIAEIYNPKKISIIEESILRCPISDDDFELNVIWTIINTYLEADKILSCSNPSKENILFDRGILDRLAFSRLLGLNDRYFELSKELEKLILITNLISKVDYYFLFLTSYEKAIYRKNNYKYNPNSKHRFTNKDIITSLNRIFISIYKNNKKKIPIYLIDDRHNEISIQQKIDFCRSVIFNF